MSNPAKGSCYSMKRQLKFVFISVGVLFIVVFAVWGTLHSWFDGQEITKDRLIETATGSKPYHGRIQYRARGARPSINEPEFLPADEAYVADGTKGIGIAVNNESRFYPLYILQYHQVINDNIGDAPVSCEY